MMMTGLIGPDLRREDCWSGPSHDDWRKTCLMEDCDGIPAEKLGISYGRSSKDGYHIYRVPPTEIARVHIALRSGRHASDQGFG